ncbi:hypothetical protein LUZ61_014943 [Rhynchospora tenuis]|uniref:ATP-dependent helicase BRM n=1 Tax=Rhynchospora tenuis TaxID=198213 RepID=A0AAD5Z3F1_9POAL|nr:hypothetical protein LUZ61_014943 [Rhynchospora tenuis]
MQAGSSGQGQQGFDPMQQQQNLVFRQAMQQQEQHHQQQPQQQQQQQINFQPGSGPHPIMNSNNLPNFPSTSGGPPQMRVQNLQMQQNPILSHAYLQYAMQQQQQAQQQQQQVQQQQQKPHASLVAPQQQPQNNAATANALKVQELMSLQRNSNNNSGNNNNQHMPRPTQPQPLNPNSGNPNPGPTVNNANQLAMLQQMQMMQAWAKEQNIDLSVPANMNLVAQMLPIWQNATRMAAMQQQQKNPGESSASTMQGQQHQQHQQLIMPSPGGSEGSASHGSNQNPLSEMSGQQHGGMLKPRKPVQQGVISGDSMPGMLSNLQHERGARPPVMQLSQASSSAHNSNTVGTSTGQENPGLKGAFTGPNSEMLQMQYMRQLQQQQQQQNHQQQQQQLQQQQMQQVQVPPIASTGIPNPGPGPGPGNPSGEAGGRQGIGFSKKQLHVLKAQILAFRRLKRGDRTLPPEVMEAIMAPPLDPSQSQPHPAPPSSVPQHHERLLANTTEELPMANQLQPTSEKPLQERSPLQVRVPQPVPKPEGTFISPMAAEDRSSIPAQISASGSSREPQAPQQSIPVPGTSMVQNNPVMIKPEQEIEKVVPIQRPSSAPQSDNSAGDKGKAVVPPDAGASAVTNVGDTDQTKKATTSASASTSGAPSVSRKYNGPIFDFPSFTRKNEAIGTANYNSSLQLKYDIKDLLGEAGPVILKKRRAENLKKISGLLAINLERKRIRPDLVLRLQIEEKKLKLLELQSRVREEVDQEQQEIMAMPDRPYRKFVRQCERQRVELARQVQQLQRAQREKHLKLLFQWRKKFLEAHWAVRDARTQRNRGVAKYHERMLKDFAKRKDDDRNKRMEALKNNDVERYRQMLLEQQTSVPGDAAQRYNVLSSFLTQTEEYLLKLGGKITSAKTNQEVEEAASAAAAAARAQGLSEEEVRIAAACAREEVMIRNQFSEMNAPKESSSSANKYYNLAHAVNEKVVKQPSMLRKGTLRDYQLVGLQWMLSLYNNKLNGILADEMGLGKTVQVMALIAYLMEFKGNYGPHLIIVPNAVLVNWKSELLNWLPSVSCIFYVGTKDHRAKLFSQVSAVKFNVLVTTYEFVMYDRSKLSRIDWKYIIIDEAQRMKDRESVLARDLDRYRCQRRLLLTGTPLQNDLKELWSLLNLLLPEVFDNKKAFQEWFSKPFQRDGPSDPDEDDWLETEKKVIIIHRLHQILEPFMLRRRVEDVEGSLPRKESIVLRCRMSAMQGAVYDWIKSTGTIRVDPEDESRKTQKNPMYQPKSYKTLNNKCMELRKVCNHPVLSYPSTAYFTKDFIVRSCGKLWVLDRILVKLHQAGHRVLLFSTMTKLLDIMEEYLQWRQLVYRRIDGTTSLEEREAAIVDFNAPNSDCFIFLLSIRAAGRGLNLQTADTVVIYDPDPNPQNEEQAVARAHRIGQTREVKVIYLQAVVDKISSYQKEDDLRAGGSGTDFEDDLIGKDRYIGSIESLIRNNIQQYKIDMADEVINAGRFDQRTTHEERRMTLETLLHDEERYQETLHDVPSLQQVNRMIARTEEEVEMFDQMDEEYDWPGDMVRHNQVPKWLRTSTDEVETVMASLSKKPWKNALTSKIDLQNNNNGENSSARRRGRPVYREIDESDDESEESEDERNPNLAQEEEGEIGESEDEEDEQEEDDAGPSNKDLQEEGEEDEEEEEEAGPNTGNGAEGDYYYEDALDGGDGTGNNDAKYEEETGGRSTGSSSGGSQRLPQPTTPSESSQKFGSLSALEARPGSVSKRTPDDLEEGEIALSGDYHMEVQPSASWNPDQEEGYEEKLQLRLQQQQLPKEELQQIPAPKIKRKRSMRNRPRFNNNNNNGNNNSGMEKSEERSSAYRSFGQKNMAQPSFDTQSRENASAGKQKKNAQTKKGSPSVTPKSGRLSHLSGSGSADGRDGPSKGGWSVKPISGSGSGSGSDLRMTESTQRKCKNVISKLWKRIDRDGHQIIPLLSDWWRRNEKATFMKTGSSLLDLRRIELRVDGSEYSDVMDFIADLQLMLKNVLRYFNSSYTLYQVRNEAERLHSLFFDIMKIAFPDADFREIKSSINFSTLSTSVAASPKSGKRQAPNSKPDTTRCSHSSDVVNRAQGSSKSQRDPTPAPLLKHPGDLVICKKKRKDREKPTGKYAVSSPSSSNRIGPLNPGRMGPVSPAATNSSKGTRTLSQRDQHSVGWGQGSSNVDSGVAGIGDVQWAKPVKRMRSDTGKRRPSHL